nr:MAG TPA: hypothetical protein [Ackermannviridae sp.]
MHTIAYIPLFFRSKRIILCFSIIVHSDIF